MCSCEKKIFVIGGNHHNTLGLVRSLGREGVLSYVILQSHAINNYVLKSKYVYGYTIANTEEEIVDALMGFANEINRQIIVCTSDFAASVIDNYRYKLALYYQLPGCKEQGRLSYLMNKDEMAQIAAKSGLIVPESKVFSSTTRELIVVNYPCIIKPLISVNGSKGDIAICNNLDELNCNLNHCGSDYVQIQKYIEKELEYQLIGLSACGKIIIPGKSIIITQPKNTNTGFLKYTYLDGTEPIKACEKFIQLTGYEGLFSIEFIRDKNGNDYFMEINFRNDGNAICVTEAGVNLPYLWYKLKSNDNINFYEIINKTKIHREVYVIPEYNEVNLWYSGQINLKRMISDFKLTDVYMEYASDDLLPTNGKNDLIKLILLSAIKKPIRLILRFLTLHK